MKKVILLALVMMSCSKEDSDIAQTEGKTLRYYKSKNLLTFSGNSYLAYDTINNKYITEQEYSVRSDNNTNFVSIKSDKIITNVRVFCEAVNYTVSNSSNTVSFEIEDYDKLSEFKDYVNIQLTYINN